MERSRRIGITELSGTTFSLLQQFPGNYAHWLLQGLPRVELVRRVVDLASIDQVLVHAAAPAFTDVVLEELGVRRNRVVRVPEPVAAYLCERLVAATPVLEMGATPEWACRFLREQLLRSPEGPERLLVVRPGPVRRQILDAALVRSALEKRAFTGIAMEDRTIPEQAGLFAAADFIVAEHGAALANLVFARPGTRVIELMPANSINWCYAVLAVRLGLRYQALLGSEPTLPPRLWTWQADADQIVDVDALVAMIDAS